jgi:hypothetical protein
LRKSSLTAANEFRIIMGFPKIERYTISPVVFKRGLGMVGWYRGSAVILSELALQIVEHRLTICWL